MRLSLFALLVLFMTSCSMDYHKNDSGNEPQYDFSSDKGKRRRSYQTHGSAYQSTRERMLSGDYSQPTQQQEVRQESQAVQEAPKEPEKKVWVDPNRDIAKRYPIKNVSCDQIEPLIRGLLSPNGGLSYIRQFNSILVLDKPAVHEKVKAVLDATVRDAVNVRIDVEFAGNQSFDDYGINVRHNGIIINDGKVHWPDKVAVDIRGQSGRQQTNTKQLLTTMSGHAASLWVTNTVVDKQIFQQYRFIPFHGRLGGRSIVLQAPQVREVGTSLYILPIYGDDGMVTVELFPVLTTEVGGKRQSFRVEKVQTRVTGRPGQRLFLGGMDRSMNNFFSSIFNPIGVNKGKVTDLVNIYVTPYVMKRGNGR
ncbi:MAG: type II and III secretion system protein [Lentisphaerales bacterium]|nr:type II and III secretion system protein [Lentisphaerales bacterium]